MAGFGAEMRHVDQRRTVGRKQGDAGSGRLAQKALAQAQDRQGTQKPAGVDLQAHANATRARHQSSAAPGATGCAISPAKA